MNAEDALLHKPHTQLASRHGAIRSVLHRTRLHVYVAMTHQIRCFDYGRSTATSIGVTRPTWPAGDRPQL